MTEQKLDHSNQKRRALTLEAPKLDEALEARDEQYAQGVIYGERIISLITYDEGQFDEEYLHQALELMLYLDGYEDGMRAVLQPLLIGGDPKRLKPSDLFMKCLGELSYELICAVYVGVLWVTGEWRKIEELTLHLNPYLCGTPLYQAVDHLIKLEVSCSSALRELGPLSSLTHLSTSVVDDLEDLHSVLSEAPLQEIQIRELSSSHLNQLARRPNLWELCERGARALKLTPAPSRHRRLQGVVEPPDLDGRDRERLISLERRVELGSLLCGSPSDEVTHQVKATTFEMIYCPPGAVELRALTRRRRWGKPDADRRLNCELTRPFWIGKSPVTQALWEAVTGERPSYFKGATRPVERVTWWDCLRFCNQLSEQLGLDPVYQIISEETSELCFDHKRNGFRLPTEAEWVYASLAGERQEDYDLDRVQKQAWHEDNSDSSSCPTCLLEPNPWGIHDMLGNVSEWCCDRLDAQLFRGSPITLFDPCDLGEDLSYRSGKGGNWNRTLSVCMPRYDYSRFKTSTSGFDLGLRLVRSI